MYYRSISLGRVLQPAQEDLMIMNRLARALEQLLSAQPSTKHRDFIQQFQKVDTAYK